MASLEVDVDVDVDLDTGRSSSRNSASGMSSSTSSSSNAASDTEEQQEPSIQQCSSNNNSSSSTSSLALIAGPSSNGSGGDGDAGSKVAAGGSSSPERPRPPRTQSPDTVKCAICLGELNGPSYSNTCCHQFCFECLREWSKVKPECPLCKSTFRSIYHNIRDIADYDEYVVPVAPMPHLSFRIDAERFSPPEVIIRSGVSGHSLSSHDYSMPHFRIGSGNSGSGTYARDPRQAYSIMRIGFNATQIFRDFRPEAIDLTVQRQMLPNENPFYYSEPEVFGNSLDLLHRAATSSSSSNPQFSGYQMRRRRYDRSQWVRPFDSALQPGSVFFPSVEYFQRHVSATRRISPWLHRELTVLLGLTHSITSMANIYDTIVELLQRYEIRSLEFRQHLRAYFGLKTRHFQHEFYHFVLSGMRMEEYDRIAQYSPESTTRSSASTSAAQWAHPGRDRENPLVVTIDSDSEDGVNANRNDNVEILISDDDERGTSSRSVSRPDPPRSESIPSPVLDDEACRMLERMLESSANQQTRRRETTAMNEQLQQLPTPGIDLMDALDPFDLSDPPANQPIDFLDIDDPTSPTEEIDLNNLTTQPFRSTTPSTSTTTARRNNAFNSMRDYPTSHPFTSSSTAAARSRASTTINLLNSLRARISNPSSSGNNGAQAGVHDPVDGRQNPCPYSRFLLGSSVTDAERPSRSSPTVRNKSKERGKQASSEQQRSHQGSSSNDPTSVYTPSFSSSYYLRQSALSALSANAQSRTSSLYNNSHTSSCPTNTSSVSSVQISIYPSAMDLSSRSTLRSCSCAHPPSTTQSIIQPGLSLSTLHEPFHRPSTSAATVGSGSAGPSANQVKDEDEGLEFLGVHPIVKKPPLAVITLTSSEDEDESAAPEQQTNTAESSIDKFSNLFHNKNRESESTDPRNNTNNSTECNELSSLPMENMVERHLDAVASGFAYPMSMLPDTQFNSSCNYSPFTSGNVGGAGSSERDEVPSTSSLFRTYQTYPASSSHNYGNIGSPAESSSIGCDLLSIPTSTSPFDTSSHKESTKNKSKSKTKTKKELKEKEDEESISKTKKVRGEKRKRSSHVDPIPAASTSHVKSVKSKPEKRDSSKKKHDSKPNNNRRYICSGENWDDSDDDEILSNSDADKAASINPLESSIDSEAEEECSPSKKKKTKKSRKTKGKSKSKPARREKKEKDAPSRTKHSLSSSRPSASASCSTLMETPSTSAGNANANSTKKLKSVVIKVDRKKKKYAILSSSSDEEPAFIDKKLRSVIGTVKCGSSNSSATSPAPGYSGHDLKLSEASNASTNTASNRSPTASASGLTPYVPRKKLLRRWESGDDDDDKGEVSKQTDTAVGTVEAQYHFPSSSDDTENGDDDLDDYSSAYSKLKSNRLNFL